MTTSDKHDHPNAPGGSDVAQASSMWGGRFAAGPAAIMADINASIDFDKKLWREDIEASKAHAAMLGAQGIIDADSVAAILAGLDTVAGEIEAGGFSFKQSLEDIHMNVESRLAELIGPAAGRLHTARSRNDQVATDFKLWVRRALARLDRQLQALQAALIEKAEAHAETIMPGFTHLQTAQPITFGHHCLAYVEMFGRDRSRVQDALKRADELPLGSGALAGVPFPIDRQRVANALGFARPTANSLDTVSDRDFALDYLASAAICATHLSRFAEEIVLWCTSQFRFITLTDAFSTGSSMMPQKRNPDAAELVRGKTGRVIGDLNALLVVLKGLPLAYSKDMQEDKEAVFDAEATLTLCIAATEGMVKDMRINAEAMRAAVERGYPTATDLADWLVKRLNIPFRQAHHITGTIVKKAEAAGVALDSVPLAEMQAVEPRITAEIYPALSVESSLNARASEGGTAPTKVREAVAAAKRRFL
jgi:argininosuccinate lyase